MIEEFWADIHAGKFVKCPCCKNLTKKYPRSINYRMVQALERLSVAGENGLTPNELYHYDGKKAGGDPHKLRFWGLTIATQSGAEKRWHITDKGRTFLLGELSVPKYAYIVNNEAVGYSIELMNVKDCKAFDLAELLSPEAA